MSVDSHLHINLVHTQRDQQFSFAVFLCGSFGKRNEMKIQNLQYTQTHMNSSRNPYTGIMSLAWEMSPGLIDCGGSQFDACYN